MSVSAPHWAEGESGTAFKKRRVGQTNLEVTELGIGTATFPGQLGVKVPIEGARQTIDDALAAGVRYFDTAPMYGFGLLRAHPRRRAAVPRRRTWCSRPRSGGCFIRCASEAERAPGSNPWTQPFPFTMTYDYSYDAIMRSFEESLHRLGLGKIDILLVHDIGVQTHGAEVNATHWKALADSGYRALSELKAQGLVSAIGLGVNEVHVLMDAFEDRRLGHPPPRQPLHPARADAAPHALRRVPEARHLDACGRPVRRRHPCRAPTSGGRRPAPTTRRRPR